MRDFITVAKFTARDLMSRKSFLISNLIVLILIVALFNVPNIMNTIKGEEDTGTDEIIKVVDTENLIGKEMIESLNTMELGDHFEVSTENREELEKQMEEEKIKAAIVLSQKENNMQVEYITQSLGMADVSSKYQQVFNELYKNIKLANSGLTAEQMVEINTPIEMKVTELKEGSSGGNLFLIMMLCIVLFYAIYFCAYQVSSSITTEKTSKIMETLVTSTTPRTIVLGKTLGIGLVGLLQIASIVIVAFVSYQLFIPEGFLEGIIDVSRITPMFVIMTFVYFILGYFLYALLYALTGSTVSKPEDISSANTPVALVAVIAFYLSYFSMMNPTSSINTFASLFPFSAPFSMPFRIMGGTASTGEMVGSLVIMIITILVVAQIAIKIYSSAILHYGTKIGIKDMFKMYKDKNN